MRGSELLSYEALLERLAIDCDGFSGASLAGVARAAASHALERAVNNFSAQLQQLSPLRSNDDGGDDEEESRLQTVESPNIMDCCVTQEDFYEAILDVKSSTGSHDYAEEKVETVDNNDEEETVK
jgi:SpoVK/Ycf46/Vps4 family AAA+-type ATPase